MRRLLTLGACLALMAGVSAGCGDAVGSNEFSPSQQVTETFTGTLVPGGAQTHLFVTIGKGVITATITAIGKPRGSSPSVR